MANEIRVQISIQVKKDNFQFQNQPTAFLDDMAGDAAAPSPGRITVSEQGTDVDLSKVGTPGWALFRNLDNTNYVQLGVWNPDQSEFYPFARIKPGTHFLIPLDPDINEEYAGTGTGTTGQLNTLRLLASTLPCECEVWVFEA